MKPEVLLPNLAYPIKGLKICKDCEKDFIGNTRMSKYCPKCAEARHKATQRRTNAKRYQYRGDGYKCMILSYNREVFTNTEFVDTECKVIHRKRRMTASL